MLLGVLDINGALVSLTSLPSLWLRLHAEHIRPVVAVVPVSIHGDTMSRDGFVCGLRISSSFSYERSYRNRINLRILF